MIDTAVMLYLVTALYGDQRTEEQHQNKEQLLVDERGLVREENTAKRGEMKGQ